jgi:hypothetical protein
MSSFLKSMYPDGEVRINIWLKYNKKRDNIYRIIPDFQLKYFLEKSGSIRGHTMVLLWCRNARYIVSAKGFRADEIIFLSGFF